MKSVSARENEATAGEQTKTHRRCQTEHTTRYSARASLCSTPPQPREWNRTNTVGNLMPPNHMVTTALCAKNSTRFTARLSLLTKHPVDEHNRPGPSRHSRSRSWPISTSLLAHLLASKRAARHVIPHPQLTPVCVPIRCLSSALLFSPLFPLAILGTTVGGGCAEPGGAAPEQPGLVFVEREGLDGVSNLRVALWTRQAQLE